MPNDTPGQAWDGLLDASAGEMRPFERFCAGVQRQLLGYMHAWVRNDADAEELAQESLYRFYKMIQERKIKPEKGSPRSLLFAIAHNLAADHRRRYRAVRSLDAAKNVAIDPTVAPALLRGQIEKALRRLPDNQRDAIMLREFGELTYLEIADAMNASLSEVKTWIYRSRRALAELLDRDGQYLGDIRNG